MGMVEKGKGGLNHEAFEQGKSSVDPRHRDPLSCSVHSLYGSLQSHDRLLNVIVHDCKIKEVSIRLSQQV